MYILWNFDFDEPIAVSEDKGLLQEMQKMLYDCFMKDAYIDYWYKKNSNSEDSWYAPTLDWYTTLDQYNQHIGIMEAPFYT